MEWLSFVVLLLFFLVMVVLRYFQRKEVREMTLEKFEKKVSEFVSKKDSASLLSFLKRHAVFCFTHSVEIEAFFKEISESALTDYNNEKGD